MKKILCLINHLGSGGAQRQMVYLNNLLNEKGYDVTLVTFYDLNYQENFLKNTNKLVILNKGNRLKKLFDLIKLFYQLQPDIVISYLRGPNHLAALLRIANPFSNVRIITSERNFNVSGITLKEKLARIHHIFAKQVVCNAYSQKELLLQKMPIIKRKLVYIPNVLDFTKFTKKSEYIFKDTIRFLVPASLIPSKNPMGLAKAVNYLSQNHPNLNFRVDWFGSKITQIQNNKRIENGLYKQIITFINDNNLAEKFQIHDTDPNLNNVFHTYDCLILPSFYEGCPNALMDAMACGLPILASNIGDNPLLIHESGKELLFDPYNTIDIAGKIKLFVTLSLEKRKQIGQTNYKKAKELFSEETFINKYISLLD